VEVIAQRFCRERRFNPDAHVAPASGESTLAQAAWTRTSAPRPSCARRCVAGRQGPFGERSPGYG
jgi:hypothetical protein